MSFVALCLNLFSPGAMPGVSTGIRALLLTASLALGWVAVPNDAFASERSAFMAEHRCKVVAVLREIHRRGPVETSRNRFVTLAVRNLPQHYVQCIFIDRDTAMYCEASSGAYATDDQSRVRLVPTKETRDTLHRLGFKQDDPKKNYSQELSLGSPPSDRRAADLMLTTLFDAYHAGHTSDLEIHAPNGGATLRTCGAPSQ